MNTLSKIDTFIDIFYACHPFPMHHFSKGRLLREVPKAPFDFVSLHIDALRRAARNNIAVMRTDDYLIFGYICEADEALETEIVIGPIAWTALSSREVLDIRKTYQIEHDRTDTISTYIPCIPGYSASLLANILSLVNIFLNKENDLAFRYVHTENDGLKQQINQILSDDRVDGSDPVSYQSAYIYEQELLGTVKRGDVEKIRRHRVMPSNMHIGDFGDTPLRKIKNLYICSVALTRAAAMEGGLDLETAYRLSDHYLREGEKQTNPAQMAELNNTMLVDYTQHCHDAELSGDIPRDVFRCMQYVRQHTGTPLQVADVARYAGMSRSQLTRKFKNSLGVLPGEFIMLSRLEQSRYLLEQTQKPISAISDSLCFSSQSYFTNVFKKHYSLTPLAYRQNRRQDME